MSEARQLEHSPGPWTISNDADGWDNIVDADDQCIAEVDSCSGGKDPDARLIAAAPDMLRLLRVLRDGLDEYWESQNAAIVSEASELIARLDGQQP